MKVIVSNRLKFRFKVIANIFMIKHSHIFLLYFGFSGDELNNIGKMISTLL